MSFFNPRLGIDVGSEEVVVYKQGEGIVLREPTVVAISPEEGRIIAFGHEAREMMGKMPDALKLIKPVRDGVIADYKFTVRFFSYCLSKTLSKLSVFKPEIVVNIPSSISGTERRALVESLHDAGARNVYVLKEPILAAIGSGVNISEPVGRMIVNIGGGTTDVAVISLGGVVYSKSVKYGGQKIDEAIMNMVKVKHGCVIGERSAEMIKLTIGSATPLKEEKGVKVRGRDYETGQPKEITIFTNEVADCILPILNQILACTREVFTETPPELASDIMDNGVMLSGSQALLSNMDKFFNKNLGLPTTIVEEPKLCVAKGLGLILDNMDFYKRAMAGR